MSSVLPVAAEPADAVDAVDAVDAPVRVADFADIDRRIALAFGALLLGVVLVALLVGGWYLRGVMEREQARLADITTQVLADAVGRVSFAGKHQARLFVEQIKQSQADIAWLRVVDAEGVVVAHSDPQLDDSVLDAGERAAVAAMLAGRAPLLPRALALADGSLVREHSAAYRGGFDNRVQGLVQVGITDAASRQALRRGVLYMLAVACVLAAAGIALTWRGSRRVGDPVRPRAAHNSPERQRLENTLQAMQAGTWEWRLDTGAVRLSERWAGIMGYTLAELEPLSEQTFARLCHPDDLAESRRRVDAHLAGRSEGYACESRMRHKDGHWVWVLDSGRIVERDAEGRPLRMMGARQDVTERRAAQEASRLQSERFLALAQVSNTGVWEWDHERQHLWCSPEYFGMLGRDGLDQPSEGFPNLEQAWLQWLHPQDLERARRAFADYLASGSPGMYDSQFRMLHADGSWVWVWSRGSTLRDAEGRITSRTLGTHINVSSLKLAEAQLRESQQRMALISDRIPDSMVFQNDCGLAGEMRRFTYLSEGVQRLHGLSVDEVMREPQRLYAQVHPDDRDMLVQREAQCIAALIDFKVEVRCILPDGSLRWFMIVTAPRRMEDSGHIVFDGIEMDITERKQREHEIQQLNATLEQRVQERTAELSATLQRLRRTQDELLQSEKLASLGALVAGVAHELNTPIGNAVTVASTLTRTHSRFKAQAEAGLTRSALAAYLADVEEGGQIIERNLSRAAELIGGFKQLAADQTSAQRRRFALADVVQEVALAMRPGLRRAGVRLLEEIPRELRMDSYPGPLGQVLMNLINNAIVHAFAGRAGGRITLKAQALEPDRLLLSVADDGCGIAPEHHKKVYDPFFTTRLGQGGSGLGLNIVHTLVSGVLGGRIELHSTPGAGTRFDLWLPRSAPQPPPRPDPA